MGESETVREWKSKCGASLTLLIVAEMCFAGTVWHALTRWQHLLHHITSLFQTMAFSTNIKPKQAYLEEEVAVRVIGVLVEGVQQVVGRLKHLLGVAMLALQVHLWCKDHQKP
jgi:hypothetical protein